MKRKITNNSTKKLLKLLSKIKTKKFYDLLRASYIVRKGINKSWVSTWYWSEDVYLVAYTTSTSVACLPADVEEFNSSGEPNVKYPSRIELIQFWMEFIKKLKDRETENIIVMIKYDDDDGHHDDSYTIVKKDIEKLLSEEDIEEIFSLILNSLQLELKQARDSKKE